MRKGRGRAVLIKVVSVIVVLALVGGWIADTVPSPVVVNVTGDLGQGLRRPLDRLGDSPSCLERYGIEAVYSGLSVHLTLTATTAPMVPSSSSIGCSP